MGHAKVYALSVVLIIGVLVAAIGGSYALGLAAISRSQHRWCATLDLLTSTPAPKPAHPTANPSRERDYEFYRHLSELNREFGC